MLEFIYFLPYTVFKWVFPLFVWCALVSLAVWTIMEKFEK